MGQGDFQRDLATGEKSAWHALEGTLNHDWIPGALPLVRAVRQSSQADEALNLIVEHGDDADLDSIIASLEKLTDPKSNPGYRSSQAQLLLTSTRLHPTPEQEKRLEAIH